MVAISRPWYNCSYTMAAKPIKSLELHYTMMQFLIIIYSHYPVFPYGGSPICSQVEYIVKVKEPWPVCISHSTCKSCDLFKDLIAQYYPGGGGGTWVQFCWVCAAGLSEPLPHYSLFLWPVIDPILVTFWENVIFAIPTKSLSIYFFSYPKNPKMCDPILVTLLKMQPHSSQSRRENATPSSGTSPLASYKGVPPPPRAVLELIRMYDNCLT